jgi:hypothetical protein
LTNVKPRYYNNEIPGRRKYMKRLLVIFAIIALVTASVIGCGSMGGGGGGAKLDRYKADLSTFEIIKNQTALTKQWDGYKVPFPEFPVDITQFRRITVRLRTFNDAGHDITGWSASGVVRVVWNLDLPESGLKAAANVIINEVNGGFEGLGQISSNEGVLMGRLSKVPAGLYVECNSADVKFIEITEIIFHNGEAFVPEPRPIGDLGAFSVLLGANFQYGNGYQGSIKNNFLLGGHKLTTGDVFTLKMTYTASRDMSNRLQVGFVDTSPGVNYWRPLAWGDKTTLDPSKAGEEVSVTITLTVTTTSTGTSTTANTFVFDTHGTPDEGPLTLNFTEFLLTKQ